MILSAPLHRAAGGDHAAVAGGGAGRDRWRSGCCRWRRCRRWTFPPISVTASLPGASPETMASSVATPLERALGAIAGVTEMTSSSTQGSTRITLQFDLSRDIDGAARDVQAAINACALAAAHRRCAAIPPTTRPIRRRRPS